MSPFPPEITSERDIVYQVPTPEARRLEGHSPKPFESVILHPKGRSASVARQHVKRSTDGQDGSR